MKNKLCEITFLPAIVLVILLYSGPVTAMTEKQWFDKGVLLLKQEKYQEAVQAFTSLIEMAPNTADAFKNRGVAYMKQNKFDMAIRDFEQTKTIEPELKGLYSNLGVAWYYKKEYKKAIENYDKEIQLSPKSYFAYFNRAICTAELNQIDESINDLDKALKIRPDLYLAFCLKGDLFLKKNRPDLARQAYEKAMAIDSRQAYAKDKLDKLESDQQQKAAATQDDIDNQSPNQTGSSPPVTSKKNGEKKYQIQLGAFKDYNNAAKMKKQMKAKGINATVVDWNRPGQKTWYLVRFGEYNSYETAKQAEAQFETNLNMDVMVKRMDLF